MPPLHLAYVMAQCEDLKAHLQRFPIHLYKLFSFMVQLTKPFHTNTPPRSLHSFHMHISTPSMAPDTTSLLPMGSWSQRSCQRGGPHSYPQAHVTTKITATSMYLCKLPLSQHNGWIPVPPTRQANLICLPLISRLFARIICIATRVSPFLSILSYPYPSCSSIYMQPIYPSFLLYSFVYWIDSLPFKTLNRI